MARLNNINEDQVSASSTSSPITNSGEEQSSSENYRTGSVATFTSNWRSFTGSINAYGVLYSSSKPLQYNDELNTVSFIHRKSNTYSMAPQPTLAGALSGGIVSMISGNWGNSWDSTLLWNNNTQWARYPQGGIYNPNGNTNINNAHVVAMGPVVTSNGDWTGNFFASKPLGAANYNNIASDTPNAQQFLPSTAPYGTLNKVDFAYNDFASTDDGVVHSIGLIADNVNPTVSNYRGARVIKGAFNAGTFTWTGDSIIPGVSVASGGTKDLIGIPFMAWNESGTVGYVFHIGCNITNTVTVNANRGYQPIIFKTTNGGISWSEIPGIDFTLPSFAAPVLDRLLSTRSNSNITIPFFNFTEGISSTVDKNDDLHIVSTLFGSSSAHPDSLGFTFRFNNADGETYSYPHVPGVRPYVYDFIGGANTSTPWKVIVVDSLSTEVPGDRAAEAGYLTNPFVGDPATGDKVLSASRIQASRTPDGKYIVYTFAESDTSLTSSAFKWNQIPNVKARLLDVSTGNIHPNEINVTRPSLVSLRNTNVSSRAFFHYASSKCALAQTISVGPNGPAIILPMTVSNNLNLDPLSPISHRYSTTALNFGGVSEADILLPGNTVGFAENKLLSVNSSFIFPNPAKNNAILEIVLQSNSNVEVSVVNLMGQVIQTSSTSGQLGSNSISLDLNNISKGIYLVHVKIDNASSTKKLIVE